MSDHINGYALALFSLGQEEKKLKNYKDNAMDLIHAFAHNPDYIKLLDSKSMPNEMKHQMIQKAVGKKVEKSILNFIKILVDRSKVNLLVAILTKLIKLINTDLKISEGIVYTISPLNKGELSKVESRTSKMMGHKITLRNKIDAELVSGLKIVVGDETIEDSILSRLEFIKYELLDKEDD